MKNKKKLSCFILDVDGVMTTGHFIYSKKGKIIKVFGPDDNDGLSLLRPFMNIHFVTGDHSGYDVSKKRIVNDMKYTLDLVSTIRRVDWIKKRFKLNEVIYMGDGIFDHYVMKEVGYSIAPANSDKLAKEYANFVTERSGGNRAVAEACLHIMQEFFEPYNPKKMPSDQLNLGEWTV